MYAVRGKSWIAMGDPDRLTRACRRPHVAFLEEVDRHAGWPVFYQVSPAHLPLYLEGGLSLVKLGEEAHVDVHLPLHAGRLRGLGAARPHAERCGLPADARDGDG